MNLNKITLSAFAIIAAASLLSSCVNKQQTQQTEVRIEQVETTKLQKTEISRIVDFSTTLQGYETVNIAPSITGNIEHIYVEVGDHIRKGDTLVRMDQTQLNNTKLTFANLQIEMERMTALRESEAISQQAYDQTKLGFDQTKQSLEFQQENTFVQAKLSGVIAAKNYEDGELYSGQPILTLTQIATLKAYVNIPESYFPLIKTGMKVDIVSDIYPDEVFPSVIEIIHPTIDAASHTFQAKLRIPNSRERLRPGMYVHTSLPLGHVEAIIVPYQSVLKLIGSNERYIFVNENNVAKRIFVKLGQRFDDKIEIISDEINVGDELVTSGQAKLVDGSKLNVVKAN